MYQSTGLQSEGRWLESQLLQSTEITWAPVGLSVNEEIFFPLVYIQFELLFL